MSNRVKTDLKKRERFAQEYLIDGCASHAAVRAGYSKKTARQQGSRLLKRDDVKKVVAKREAEIQEKIEISQEWVLRRLKHISDFNSTEIPVPMGAGLNCIVNKAMRDASAANKSTELLGKQIGMFTDKVEVSGKNGKPIELLDRSQKEQKLARLLVNFLSKNNSTT